jgi:alpha-L-fucosidase
VSIRPGWFWHPEQDSQVRSPDNLIELYFSSVGRNAGLLLNVPPTTSGLLHERDVQSLAGFGARLRAIYDGNLATTAMAKASGDVDRAHGAARATESDPDTFWGAPAPPAGGADGPWLELEWLRPVAFDTICIQEAIAHGQHVERHAVEYWMNGAWVPLVRGTTIGYKRLHRVRRAASTRVRLRIDSALAPPRISTFALYDSGR